MEPKTAETTLVAGMIEDRRIQAFIRRALGADKAALPPPELEFASSYIRSMFVDAGVRDECRFAFELLKIDPRKVDWWTIGRSQIAKHFPSAKAKGAVSGYRRPLTPGGIVTA
jgi:hypothetical protein